MRQLRGCLTNLWVWPQYSAHARDPQPQLNVLLRLVNLLSLNNLAATRPECSIVLKHCKGFFAQCFNRVSSTFT